MKHVSIIKLFVLLFVLAFLPISIAQAASLYFSELKKEYQQGDVFSVSVFINPENIRVYTVKIELNYPSDLLQVRSFGFGNSWMPLSQAGYDVNTSGTLIKTAGYPNGAASSVLFGKVVFYVKKTGTGAIHLSNNSLVYNQDSQNVLSGSLPRTELAFVAPIANPKPVTAKQVNKEVDDSKQTEKEPAIENIEPEKIIVKEELKVDSKLAWKYTQLAALSFGVYVLDHKIIIYGGLLLSIFFVLKIIIKLIIHRSHKE